MRRGQVMWDWSCEQNWGVIRTFGTLKKIIVHSKELSKTTRMRVYNAIVKPTLIYGSNSGLNRHFCRFCCHTHCHGHHYHTTSCIMLHTPHILTGIYNGHKYHNMHTAHIHAHSTLPQRKTPQCKLHVSNPELLQFFLVCTMTVPAKA